MSGMCPYCPPSTYGEGWSMSPEAWDYHKEKHNKDHMEKCASCGQPTKLKEEI